jgi:FMN phosphatase YigB (HAD superfamily)
MLDLLVALALYATLSLMRDPMVGARAASALGQGIAAAATCGSARLRAIIFDIDGTLYHQGALRREMALRLLRGHAGHPIRGLRTLRILRAYRRAQELLRLEKASSDLAEAQIRLTCERTGLERPVVAACVAQWIEQEPLLCLKQFIRPGLLDFVKGCRARGLRLGALSDYPAEAKLQALDLRELFDVVLCAQSSLIGVFKPHPLGLKRTLEQLGASAGETLYVGDRVEVDAAAAAAAGIACAIIGRRRSANLERNWLEVAGYAELQALLFQDRSAASGPPA